MSEIWDGDFVGGEYCTFCGCEMIECHCYEDDEPYPPSIPLKPMLVDYDNLPF